MLDWVGGGKRGEVRCVLVMRGMVEKIVVGAVTRELPREDLELSTQME